jgi:hypothetical protein
MRISASSGARWNRSAVRALILRLSDDLSGAVDDVGEMSINVWPGKVWGYLMFLYLQAVS